MSDRTIFDNVIQSMDEAERLFDQNELEQAQEIAERVLRQDSMKDPGDRVLQLLMYANLALIRLAVVAAMLNVDKNDTFCDDSGYAFLYQRGGELLLT